MTNAEWVVKTGRKIRDIDWRKIPFEDRADLVLDGEKLGEFATSEVTYAQDFPDALVKWLDSEHVDHRVPEPPEWLCMDAQDEWRRISATEKHDPVELEVYCQAYSRWLDAETFINKHGSVVRNENGEWQPIPQVAIAETYMKVILRIREGWKNEDHQTGEDPSQRICS